VYETDYYSLFSIYNLSCFFVAAISSGMSCCLLLLLTVQICGSFTKKITDKINSNINQANLANLSL